MANNTDGIGIAVIFTTITSAVAWLAKKLYEAPRPGDYERILADNKELRRIVDDAAVQAQQISNDRDSENRELKKELDVLRHSLDGRTREKTGGTNAPVQERRQATGGRRATDPGGPRQSRRNPRERPSTG